MSELIDRILDEFKDINYAYNNCTKFDTLKSMLSDAVEVVRCGECKYWSEVDTSDGLRYGQCDYPHSAIRGNCFIRESWYCADGERREG